MAVPLLVVTTDLNFGELMRRSLESGGRFIVHLAQGAEEAKAHLREKNLTLVFLDTDRSDEEIIETAMALRQVNKQLRFIIASAGGLHTGLEELDSLGFVSKPLYIPDLNDIMNRLYPSAREDTVRVKLTQRLAAREMGKEPPWLMDVSKAAQHLTRLSLESSSQAALITRKDMLWAYAGQLPQAAAQELAESVSRYRDHRGESDLLRFVRLVSTNAEHMLYATHLTGGMMLALVFDAETPFSTIRSQATQLVHSLATAPPVEEPAPLEEDEGSGPDLSFANILTDVPPPNPTRERSREPRKIQTGTGTATTLEQEREPEAVPEPPPAVPSRPMTYRELEEEEEERLLGTTIRTRAEPDETRLKRSRRSEGDPELLADTEPLSIGESDHRIILEPVSASVYNLSYACLLIPRFPEHLLVGDLAEQLIPWLQQTCIAYGWRLEHISVHPDYLQWIASVPPATSPAHLMRIMRRQLSEKIFTDFPRYRKENPSGDYWAPGYMIVGGTQSPPAQMVRQFIQQTRERQGISNRF